MKKLLKYFISIFLIISCTQNKSIPFDYEKVPEYDGFNYQNKQGVVHTWDKFDNNENFVYRCNLVEQFKSLIIHGNCKDFLSDNLELIQGNNFHEFEHQLTICTTICQENDSLKIATCRSQGGQMIKKFPIDQIKLNPIEKFSNKMSEFENLKILEVYKDNGLVKYFIAPNYVLIKLLKKDVNSLDSETKAKNKWILESTNLIKLNDKLYFLEM
ncbi:MAG: hypothetical protein CSA38_04050 [Flavobacteriales bacterium]|nr:MAG: hypothetical protein CSA38_04050 [Flavobacteriales bacterium]